MLKRKENFKCYGIKTRPAKNRHVLFSYKRGGHWDLRFCGFGYFLERFFGFCAKRLRFFGCGVPCGLRLFRFLASAFSVFGRSYYFGFAVDEFFELAFADRKHR